MRRFFAYLVAACVVLTATDVFGQAFFDVRKLNAPPADFNASIEGDYVVADYRTDPIEDFTVSRFKIDAPGGIGGLTISLDESFVGIGSGAFLQTSSLFPQYRVADDQLSVELFGAVVPRGTYFEIVHSTPYAIRANLLGDANRDGSLAAVDIDATNQMIAAGGVDPTFDLNFDSLVNPGDTQYLVEVLIGTRFGDLNLDHSVTRRDAAQLAKFYGATGGVGWSQGDLDGEGGVNLRDLSEVARNFGFGSPPSPDAPTTVAVPEPATLELLALGLLTIGGVYRRRGAA